MKNLIFALLFVPLSLTATASDSQSTNNWVGGVGFINLSDDYGDLSISLNGIVGSLGYKIESGDNFSLIPEVRISFGVGSDSVSYFGYKADVELDSFLTLSMRGQYQLDNGVYLFAAPSYANAKVTASIGDYSETDDEWEFGVGGGIGYNFGATTSAELSYEQYDGTDALTLGLKFDF